MASWLQVCDRVDDPHIIRQPTPQWLRAAFSSGHSAKRRLQAHLDVHRLVLYTSAYEQLAKGMALDDAALQTITQAAEGLSFEVTVYAHTTRLCGHHPPTHKVLDAQLQASLLAQLRVIADAVRDSIASLPPLLEQPAHPKPEPSQDGKHTPTRRSGLSFAVDARPPTAAHHTQQQVLQDAFFGAMGFSLQVSPSAVGHRGAGNGVWLRGTAQPGQIVALYPGLVYPSSELRCVLVLGSFVF